MGLKRKATGNAGKGRIKGVPNAVGRDVKEAILRAFEKVGGEEYLCIVARQKPEVFCTLLGKVLPMQVTSDPDHPIEIVHTFRSGI